ncbi:hypothetical protein [Roseixanthobacter glucoisosaccharinicivorans]|uniref:hypothetical protein n=1 Tax=Roseixanthobacter glucoisosaccharinicivorans TaxID=3119923 RepID=UPI00372C3D06
MIGLVSIACSHESVFDEVARRIDAAHGAALDCADPFLPFTVRAYRSATEALHLKAEGLAMPPALERATGWKAGASEDGLATPEAFRVDPLDPVDSGEMIGILAIPTILQTPRANHYPTRARNSGKLFPEGRELAHILHGAWAPRRQALH